MNWWRLSNSMEGLAQLREDLHSALGRLITQCYEFARSDPSCSDYWIGEARYWQQQYDESMKLTSTMINVASQSHQPIRHPVPAPQLPPHPTLLSPTVAAAKLHQALLAAFDEPGLRQMVKFGLDVDIDAIAGGKDLNERAYNLVSWAQRVDRVGELVAAARQANPTNQELAAIGG